MRPGPVARAVLGGLTRRRVQTLVIGLVAGVSTAASVLALALIVDSNAPFDHAFAAQHGAHVAAVVDPSKATPAQLAATTRLPEVTAAAGPYPEASVTLTLRVSRIGPGGGSADLTLPPMTLAGRSSAGGPLDDIILQAGHWPRRAGQLVLSSSQLPPGVKLGQQVTVTGIPGTPRLTLVGYGTSVTDSADGWVVPAEIARLRARGTPASAQMLYRFANAGTTAAIRADVRAVAAALPAGAVAGTQSYLSVKLVETGNIAPFVPFLVAFGVIGMVMSVLIVSNVVSGAVVAGYRRIGVLKSIGFSPGQVAAAYTSLALAPAVVGCLAGLALGKGLSVPLLRETAGVFGVGALGVPVWVAVAVPAGMCCLTGVAALLPAIRAGRLSAIQAISVGRAPRAGHGYAAHRLLRRLPLPRPVTIGLAAPFARPARTAVTLAAVLLGATTVTLSVGLSQSLTRVTAGLSRAQADPVQVASSPAGVGPRPQKPGGGARPAGPRAGHPRSGIARITVNGGPTPMTAAAQRSVEAALRAQPGTRHYVAVAEERVSVAGLSQQVALTAFRGDARWTGYGMISGHWYTGPGQVDVSTHFLTVTGTAVGDTVTIAYQGRHLPVRIAGEVFDLRNSGLAMLTDWQTLARGDPGLAPDQFDVGLRPGALAIPYARSLGAALGSGYFVAVNNHSSDVVALMISLIGMLTLLLAVVAGLGVLNTVVLHTRERVHDLGVFKAVGMTPRQAIVMVVCWVAGTGLAAGLIAVPAGVTLHRYVLPAMAHAVDTGLPASYLNVYGGWELAALALAGIVIAVAGALLPAGWAASVRTASALHAE